MSMPIVIQKYLGEVSIGASESIPLGEGRNYTVAGQRIAVFRERDGGIYAVQAECPHAGGPLAEGVVGGCTVICPFHSWKFDLASGACLNDPAHRLKTYPIRDEGGQLVLTLTAQEDATAA